jgi:hypothetical protein
LHIGISGIAFGIELLQSFLDGGAIKAALFTSFLPQRLQTVGPEALMPGNPCNAILAPPEPHVQAAKSLATPCCEPL